MTDKPITTENNDMWLIQHWQGRAVKAEAALASNATAQGMAVTRDNIDKIILSVRHDGRSTDDMSYLRDLVIATMKAAAPTAPIPTAVAGEPVAWRFRTLTNRHITGAPRPGEIQIGEWWGMMGSWRLSYDPDEYSNRPGFEKQPLVPLHAASVSTPAVREHVLQLMKDRKVGEPVLCTWAGCREVWKHVFATLAGSETASSRNGPGVMGAEVVTKLVEEIKNLALDYGAAFTQSRGITVGQKLYAAIDRLAEMAHNLKEAKK